MVFAQAPTEPAPVIRSSVREVLLDVVVRDKHGKTVANLKPDQLDVYEDGVRQTVRSFRLVSGSEVRVEDEKEAQEAANPAEKHGLNPLRSVNLVCLVFSGLNAETRDLARQAARDFVENELRPNTFIGVFGLDDAGLKPLSPFSNNREHLLKAVDLAAMNQLRPIAGTTSAGVGAALVNAALVLSINSQGELDPGTVARELINSSGQVRTGTAGVDADATNPLGPRGSLEVESLGGMRDLGALSSLVKQLSPLPFQKTVLLLSTGLTRPPDQMEYWRSMIQMANKGGVTFYGLDVYGLNVCQDNASVGCLTSGSELQSSVDVLNKASTLAGQQTGTGNAIVPSILPPDQRELMRQDDYVHDSVFGANKQAGLRDLAESTGGFIIANTNNTQELLKHVMEDVDTHYEVTYEPAVEGYDGHFRRIEVKLARPDLQARTRSGYFSLPKSQATSTDHPGDLAGLRALNAAPPPHAFDFQAQALRFRGENGTSQYAVVFNVPIANLIGTPEPQTLKHRYHASLMALARDSQGQVEDWFTRDVRSDVADQYLPSLKTRHMTYERSFHLPPGHHTIETAVVDEEGNRASTSITRIDTTAPDGPDASDIMLAQEVKDLERAGDEADPFEVEGRRVIPLASNALPGSANPFLYFVLYPQNAAGKAHIRVQFFRDGKQFANKTEAVADPDPSGGVPMLITTAPKPGKYEVRIAMTQGNSTVARSLTYSIAGN